MDSCQLELNGFADMLWTILVVRVGKWACQNPPVSDTTRLTPRRATPPTSRNESGNAGEVPSAILTSDRAASRASTFSAGRMLLGHTCCSAPVIGPRERTPRVACHSRTPPGSGCHSPHLTDADLVVGAVLLRGDKAPYVVTEAMVQRMQAGSVIVDVSIDQGGCVETSRPTSHSEPIYEQHGVIHYCVTNMPGAYPRTSTLALTTVTLPYALQLAEQGIEALRADPGFAKGVNTHQGVLACKPVAETLGLRSQFKAFSAG